MSTFEFYDSKLGYNNYIVNGIKVYPSPLYTNVCKDDSKKMEENNNTFIPFNSLIRCPYCGKSNYYYNNNDFKRRNFIKDGQSKIYYVCKKCGREVNI